MTERLFYHDSFLQEFTAKVEKVGAREGRLAVVLDRTAFYPTSGGQLFDTGSLQAGGTRLEVCEVAEDQQGDVLHYIGGRDVVLEPGMEVLGKIDSERRRDHIQQHSGQHVLSAAFVRLFDAQTLSFHMGAETCTIDVAANDLRPQQLERAEELANRVVTEDRPVQIRFAMPEEARTLGVRKLPPFETEGGKYRLVDIEDFDLTACGGTHVTRTGQIGAILLRKTETVKQGMRIEFVCGERAIRIARQDYTALSEAASTYSTHIWELPQQIRKSVEEAKSTHKAQQALVEELAEFHAAQLLAQAALRNGRKVVARVFPDRDAAFVKMLAQKIVRTGAAVALLASTADDATLVFAQTPGLPFNMGALMKQVVTELGGRGGGSKDFAQGGAADTSKVNAVLAKLVSELQV
jgi:alanyl-tRNA synthetase